MNANKLISRTTAALVVFLAIAAAVLSYDALRGLAADNGVTRSLDWLWPLTLDGFIVVASLSVLRNSLLGERTAYAWSLVIGFSLASIGFNIVHAPPTLTGRAIAAVPPLALLLSFELLMSQLKSEVRRQSAINSLAELTGQAETEAAKLADLTAKNTALAAKQAEIEAAIKALQTERREAKKAVMGGTGAPIITTDETKDAAYQYLITAHEAGNEPTGAELGRYLDRSDSLGRKLKRELWPGIVNGQNGQGGGDANT